MANLLDCPPANTDGNFNIARQQGAKHEKVIGEGTLAAFR